MPLNVAGGGYRIGSGSASDPALIRQGAPAAYTAAAAPLLVGDLTGGLITYNAAGAANLQLPTVANLELTLVNAQVDDAFDFSVVSLGAGAGTVTTNTGWTLVGAMAVAAGAASRFRARKTGAAAWTLYQVD